jgi:hypothetical protein
MKYSDGKRRPTIKVVLLGGERHGLQLVLNAKTSTLIIPTLRNFGSGLEQLVYERMPRLFAEGGVWKFIPKEAGNETERS